MSMFLPEGTSQAQQQGVSSITPANSETTSEDIALMQRVLSAAARNPNMMPDQFMAYLFDYVQTQRLSIPIGQVFGYQRVSTQVVTGFASIPSPVDGQIVLLKVGSSAPFTYVMMVYDQTATQWVSPEFSFGGSSVSLGTTDTSNKFGPPSAGMSWSPVHLGGLTLQLKWAGQLDTSNTGAGHEAHGGIGLTFIKADGTSTTATYSDKNTTAPALTAKVFADWASVSDPGAYDVVLGTIYGRLASSGDAGGSQGGITARFIK